MNMMKKFGYNQNKAMNGVWIDLEENVRIKVGKIGTVAYNKAMDKALQKYKALIRATRNLSVEQNLEVTIQVYADAILLDWEGFTNEDGSVMMCTRDNRVAMLNLPDFKTIVENYAGDTEIFQDQDVEIDSKN